MLHDVSTDGRVDFDKFLNLIKSIEKKEGKLNTSIKEMLTGEMSKKNLSFQTFVRIKRRQHLLSAVMNSNGSNAFDKSPGKKNLIMRNIKNQISEESDEFTKVCSMFQEEKEI